MLDLTRVLAGPVATRTLALLGADVLRVDAPWLREDDGTHIDTGVGKRSTRLDLADPTDRATFERLLDAADVVVTGYRPGALDRYGLGAEALLDRRPSLVVAQLCAWGWDDDWSGRRGFDSLVQAGTGISMIERAEDGRPGALPAQALDHGTGYLLAAAVLRALTERSTVGAGRLVRLSLAGTATWLAGRHRPAATPGRTGRGHRALVGRDRVRVRPPAVRALSPRRRRRPHRLGATARSVGHGRAALGPRAPSLRSAPAVRR